MQAYLCCLTKQMVQVDVGYEILASQIFYA